MRMNQDNWTISGASKIGHHHTSLGKNGQDSLAFNACDGGWFYGVVCDGCGSGNFSEVGSSQLSHYIARELQILLGKFDLDPKARLNRRLFDQIPALYASIVKYIELEVYLHCRMASEEEIADYINHYWLSTIVGFAINTIHDIGVFFSAGDGVIAAGDETMTLDQANAPKYIAYNCVPNPNKFGVSKEFLCSEFVFNEFHPSSFDRIMVATDGFNHHNAHKLTISAQQGKELPESLEGQQWGKKGQTGLKRWMNIESELGYFEDDCAIVTVELVQ